MFTRRSFLTTLASAIPALAAGPVFAAMPEDVVLRGAHRHDIAPYAYFDATTGTMRGILVDLVNVLGGTGSYTITQNGFPWARAQSMVAAGSADAFCCQATAERAAYAYFAPTPIFSLAPARIFFAEDNPNADAIRAARSRQDLYRFKTADLIGDCRADAIWRHHPQRMLVSDAGTISRMLAKGHADFVLAEPIVMQFKLQELGLLGKVASIPGEYLIDAQETQVRFGLRKSFPDAKRIVERIDETIQALLSPRLHQQIAARYVS